MRRLMEPRAKVGAAADMLAHLTTIDRRLRQALEPAAQLRLATAATAPGG